MINKFCYIIVEILIIRVLDCYVIDCCCNSNEQYNEIVSDGHLDSTCFAENRQHYFCVSLCLHCL